MTRMIVALRFDARPPARPPVRPHSRTPDRPPVRPSARLPIRSSARPPARPPVGGWPSGRAGWVLFSRSPVKNPPPEHVRRHYYQTHFEPSLWVAAQSAGRRGKPPDEL